MWAQLSFVLSQITRLTDGRTDSFLVARPRIAWHRLGAQVSSVPATGLKDAASQCARASLQRKVEAKEVEKKSLTHSLRQEWARDVKARDRDETFVALET